MRTFAIVLPLLLAASLNAQVPDVTPAPPFTSMSRVPVTDFAYEVIPAAGRQERPAIATDGTNLMAVWADNRYGNYDVFASRLRADGSPIDPLGIPVAPTYMNDIDPAIAWSGTDYGVVWATQNGVFFARISREAVVTAQRKLFDTFVAEPRALEATAIAWNGDEYLVTFSYKEPNTSGATLNGILVSRDGTLRSDRFAVSQPLTGATNPSIATDGASFLVAWEETNPRQVLTTIVSPQGVVSNTSVIGVTPPALPFSAYWSTHALPKTAYNAGNYLVVWTDTVLRAQRLDATGASIGTPRAISDPAHFAITPAVVPVSPDWLILWADSPTSPVTGANPQSVEDLSGFDIVAMRLGRDLADGQDPAIVASGGFAQLKLAVARSSNGIIAMWQAHRTGDAPRQCYDSRGVGDIVADTLTPTGHPGGDPHIVAMSIADQTAGEMAEGPINLWNPKRDIAVSGDVALALWNEKIDDYTCVAYWRRFASNGQALDDGSGGYLLPEGELTWAFGINAEKVHVAASNDAFLFVFTYVDGTIGGALISRDGVPFPPWPGPFVIAPKGSVPSVASDGHNFLVTWGSPSGRVDWLGNDLDEIRGTIVTSSGTVANPGGIVLVPAHDYLRQYGPIATWTDDRYALAWSTFVQSVYPLTGISVRYVGAGGTPSGDTFVVESPRHYGQPAVSIASDGTRVLIGVGFPEYGQGYLVTGSTASEPFRIPGPHVIWDGARFVSGDVPMATFGDGHNVAIATESIRMIPASHAGGVNRVYVGFFNSLRTRAVRRN